MPHAPIRFLYLQMTVVLAVMSASLTVAADWPQWRGPSRDGLLDRSPALINAFGGESPLWKSEPITSGDLGGRGSLVVTDGKVLGLSSTHSGKTGTAEVFCLNARDGTTAWRSKLDEARSRNTGSSTPCVVGNRVFVVGSHNKVHCLNIENGRSIWECKLTRQTNEPIASSVAVFNGVAILMADVLTGLNTETGELIWTQDEIVGHESSASRWATDAGDFVVCNGRLKTYCVDPSTGKIVWQVPGGGKSSPLVAHEYGGDFLVNTSHSRKSGLSAYRLTGKGAEKLWTIRAYDRAASPVVHDGHVYAIAGGSNGHGARILCVHLDTGKTAWEEVVNFAEVSSPIVADGKLIAICGTELWLVQATPEKCTVLSQADCQITLCTSPAILNGRLYLRQSNSVSCYDLKSP